MVNSRFVQLLRHLRGAFLEAIRESDRAGAALQEIRETGRSVYLVLDDPNTEDEPEILRLAPEAEKEGETSPAFRIDHTDLTILRGLGIDPTRTLRGGRRARRK